MLRPPRTAKGRAPVPDYILNIEDYRKKAARALPEPVFAFVEGGSEDETSFRRNRDAFGKWALVPSALADVSRIDASCSVLGQAVAWPMIVAPTGMPGLLHPDGEIAIARAAAATGALYTLSTMATRSIEEVATAVPGPKAFQLYIFRDRGITRELVQRARAADYRALVLTVDIQVPSNRERDKRTGMTIPPRLTPATILAMARRPRWCLNNLLHPIKLANFAGDRADPGMPLLSFIGQQFDPSVTWDDLEWLAAEWGGPLAVKGILNPADAQRCIASGASAVILSNHGGRQLDTAPSPMDVLEATLDRLGGNGEVIVDGGIRRGTDMLKALALGANACMAGRPGLYGLAAGGQAGVQHVFELLRAEVERDMALLGTPGIAAIGRDNVIALT
jgi:L-lactate dehydrogenase (cytochrome)